MERPVEYEQTDPRWRDVPYTATGNRLQTIGSSGCGPACAAMAAATLRDRGITPKEAAAFAVKHGYRTRNDGTAWGFYRAFLGEWNIPVQQTSRVEEAFAALRQGYMVITAAARGIWTSGGHMILAWGLSEDGSRVYIHDPNSEAPYRELANAANYRKECTQFWIVKERWQEQVETKELMIRDLTRGIGVLVTAVNIDGSNFVKLRDVEKLFPVTVGWDGTMPTVTQNYLMKEE